GATRRPGPLIAMARAPGPGRAREHGDSVRNSERCIEGVEVNAMDASRRGVVIRRMMFGGVVVTAFAGFAQRSRAQLSPTTRVSVDSSGAEGNGYCNWTWISGDGRTV